MIDLRKPLEGVPGLLLMAALIFFGATIGIAIALTFTWIPMGDALANFLGGVVGAGLGAALAVMGAVYVQRKDKRDGLTGELNKILSSCSDLTAGLFLLVEISTLPTSDEPEPVRDTRRSYKMLLEHLEKAAVEMPEGAALSSGIHTEILHLKRNTKNLGAAARIFIPAIAEGEADAEVVIWFRGMIEESNRLVRSLQDHLRAFAYPPPAITRQFRALSRNWRGSA